MFCEWIQHYVFMAINLRERPINLQNRESFHFLNKKNSRREKSPSSISEMKYLKRVGVGKNIFAWTHLFFCNFFQHLNRLNHATDWVEGVDTTVRDGTVQCWGCLGVNTNEYDWPFKQRLHYVVCDVLVEVVDQSSWNQEEFESYYGHPWNA